MNERITIRPIDPKDYPDGKTIEYSYEAHTYYDVRQTTHATGWALSLHETPCETPFVKTQQEEWFDSYKAGSTYYIIEEAAQEIGVLTLQQMSWNDTLYIHDLHLIPAVRRRGIGHEVMAFIQQYAKTLRVRAVVLETQTSNAPAIHFYLSHGFCLIGLNTISYSNDDIANREVRIELGWLLP